MNKLAEDSIIMKRHSASVQDGPLNAARKKSYTPELIEHCDVEYKKIAKETEAGGRADYDAVVWVYDPTFTAGELDTVNIGGSISDGTVSGGTDYRIERADPYEDCVKLELRSI